MHLLLIHQNFPGQLRDLAPVWLEQGHDVTAISAAASPTGEIWSGLNHYHYSLPASEQISLRERGQAVGVLCRELQQRGIRPDVVLAHSGWGEALQLRRVWGSIPLMVMPELWGQATALGIGFDAALNDQTLDGDPFTLPNLVSELSLIQADAALVASRSQLDSFPPPLQRQLTLLPEGLDLSQVHPDPQAEASFPDLRLKAGDPIVTFISRQLEPLRGLRQLMRAWPQVSRCHPKAQLLLVGDEFSNGYGLEQPNGSSHLQDLMAEWGDDVDRHRVHHLGVLEHTAMLQLLRCSACHMALSYPYTLSWSVLEAMACGAPLVTNSDSPVALELEHNRSGLIVPFNDTDALASAILQLLNHPEQRTALGHAGRRIIEDRFNLATTLKRFDALFQQLQAGNRPAARR